MRRLVLLLLVLAFPAQAGAASFLPPGGGVFHGGTGTNTLVISYGGDRNYSSASTTLTLTVSGILTTNPVDQTVDAGQTASFTIRRESMSWLAPALGVVVKSVATESVHGRDARQKWRGGRPRTGR